MNKEVRAIIENVLEKEFYLRKNNNGVYEDEIYLGYQDEMSNETIKKILESSCPNDKFYEVIDDVYLNAESDMRGEYINKITFSLDLDDIEYAQDEIQEYIWDYVSISIDYNHFLKQNVRANLILDTGDGNYDFGLNSTYNYGYSRDETFEFDPCSSLLWLANQQGYTKEQLENAINNDECLGSAFLSSVSQEVSETTSCMNAVTFFIDTTLGDLLKYTETETGLVVSKDTNCGLVDYWYGAGGPLGIILEKDVVIPKEFIDSFTMDGNRGSYSVDNIYGLCNDFWNGTVK
jgi:hypothetical protein